MKLEDAPRAGWYPDPELSGLLRWWEGADWTDEHRSLPTASELADTPRTVVKRVESPEQAFEVPRGARVAPPDTEQIVAQVRAAAREEMDRAARMVTRQTRTAISEGRSLVDNYIGKILRWIRIAVLVVAIAVIIWFVLQSILQVTLLDWVGDRIDNLSD